jgi:hypothetical protein
MKAITFTVNRNGRGYVQTALVPENHTDTPRVNALGIGITLGILGLTACVIGFLALLFSH